MRLSKRKSKNIRKIKYKITKKFKNKRNYVSKKKYGSRRKYVNNKTKKRKYNYTKKIRGGGAKPVKAVKPANAAAAKKKAEANAAAPKKQAEVNAAKAEAAKQKAEAAKQKAEEKLKQEKVNAEEKIILGKSLREIEAMKKLDEIQDTYDQSLAVSKKKGEEYKISDKELVVYQLQKELDKAKGKWTFLSDTKKEEKKEKIETLEVKLLAAKKKCIKENYETAKKISDDYEKLTPKQKEGKANPIEEAKGAYEEKKKSKEDQIKEHQETLKSELDSAIAKLQQEVITPDTPSKKETAKAPAPPKSNEGKKPKKQRGQGWFDFFGKALEEGIDKMNENKRKGYQRLEADCYNTYSGRIFDIGLESDDNTKELKKNQLLIEMNSMREVYKERLKSTIKDSPKNKDKIEYYNNQITNMNTLIRRLDFDQKKLNNSKQTETQKDPSSNKVDSKKVGSNGVKAAEVNLKNATSKLKNAEVEVRRQDQERRINELKETSAALQRQIELLKPEAGDQSSKTGQNPIQVNPPAPSPNTMFINSIDLTKMGKPNPKYNYASPGGTDLYSYAKQGDSPIYGYAKQEDSPTYNYASPRGFLQAPIDFTGMRSAVNSALKKMDNTTLNMSSPGSVDPIYNIPGGNGLYDDRTMPNFKRTFDSRNQPPVDLTYAQRAEIRQDLQKELNNRQPEINQILYAMMNKVYSEVDPLKETIRTPEVSKVKTTAANNEAAKNKIRQNIDSQGIQYLYKKRNNIEKDLNLTFGKEKKEAILALKNQFDSLGPGTMVTGTRNLATELNEIINPSSNQKETAS
tara:strand:+ start:4693 stop:7095 length:2403 start_codon:yes stop_codon:yes gene_type:complete